MEKILAAGASVIVRPVGWHNHPWISIAVEYGDIRHGLTCVDLDEGLARAFLWVEHVKSHDDADVEMDAA